jgi:ABC-type sugar transport system substrate-binding protein
MGKTGSGHAEMERAASWRQKIEEGTMQRRTVLDSLIGASVAGLAPVSALLAAEKTIVYLTPGLDLPFWRYLAKGIETTAQA